MLRLPVLRRARVTLGTVSNTREHGSECVRERDDCSVSVSIVPEPVVGAVGEEGPEADGQ